MSTTIDGFPIDPANGRPICTPAKPMPKGDTRQWAHEGAAITGGCSEGCCDYFECRDCGARWTVEYDG